LKAKSAVTEAVADAALMVPVSTIAHALDLTPRRIQQLVAEDVLPKEERGRYPLIPVGRTRTYAPLPPVTCSRTWC